MKIHTLSTPPYDSECERATFSYLMSIMAVFAGLPIPIINLLATIIFYFGNKKSTTFVKWHCTQALVSQAFLFCFNSISFWWTIDVIFGDATITDPYIAYILLIFMLNTAEIIITMITMHHVRKGKHVKWFLFGEITDKLIPFNK